VIIILLRSQYVLYWDGELTFSPVRMWLTLQPCKLWYFGCRYSGSKGPEPVFWYVNRVICFWSLKQIKDKWLFLLYNDDYVYIDVFPLMIGVLLHIDCCYPLHRCNSNYQVHVMGHVPYVGWAIGSHAIVMIHLYVFKKKKKSCHIAHSINSSWMWPWIKGISHWQNWWMS
jgi:hypothetical protein